MTAAPATSAHRRWPRLRLAFFAEEIPAPAEEEEGEPAATQPGLFDTADEGEDETEEDE